MKYSLVALAASSLLGGAAAHGHQRHMHFHAAKRDAGYVDVLERGAEESTCGCTTYTSTVTGAPTLVPNPPPAPTPVVTSYTAPGTYTIAKSTITLTETTTVASPTLVTCTPGENTYGGVTVTVTAPTTVTTCVGTVSGSGVATTSVVTSTTYVCPTPGTYVIGGTSSSVSVSTVTVVPVPATYTPGTYTLPESTVTVTETGTVVVCPYATQGPPPPPASTPASPVQPTKAAPAPAPPAAKAPAPGEGYIGNSKPAPSPKASGGNKSPISANGNKWAMTYTPYTISGACKSAGDVASDIADIKGKGFSAVRLYATDCSGLENVGNACKSNGMKLLVGVFIDAGGIGAAAAQVSEIVSWGKAGNWGIVEMVVVGNEAIFNGYCSAGELAGFVGSVKGQLQGAGYSGPVTLTEPVSTVQEHAATICGAVDVIAANIQPFFNGKVVAADAGDYVAGQLKLVGDACPGKTAYNLECGWPTSGLPNILSIPGASEQAAAIKAILGSSAAANTVVFSYQNDHWKAPGPFQVEQFFGMANLIPGL